jgi:multiple sugar transport system ATP-binding protein
VGTAIEIRNLTKRFGEVIAVNNQSLSVNEGEFLALLGPSGCGKTTLLRCIAGLEEPEEGVIVINDKVVFSSGEGINVPAGQRQVGMVFQSYALWPHMTVYDNIGFGLQLKRMRQIEVRQRVDLVLDDLDMGGLGERYPSELSGGQQQRVALARLLAVSPPVFLMDEPLSNLDARLRLDMRSELKRLHFDSGATTVYVTHDQTEALTMASRVSVMRQGKIEQTDSPMEIYRYPANLFVAEFVGMPRINLIPGEAVREGGAQWLEIAPFRLEVKQDLPEMDLIVAARPEDIEINVQPIPGAVEFLVYAVLSAGPELFVNLRCEETTLVARVASQLQLTMDQPVWVRLKIDNLNIYNKSTGDLIAAPQQETALSDA